MAVSAEDPYEFPEDDPVAEQAFAWQTLEESFFGEHEDIQIRWGAVGMLAIRAGTAQLNEGRARIAITNWHRQPGRRNEVHTKLVFGLTPLTRSLIREEHVFVDGVLQDDSLSPQERYDACEWVRYVLEHTSFDAEESRIAADDKATSLKLTSYTDDRRSFADLDKAQEEQGAGSQITFAGLVQDFPELKKEITFWRYYSGDFGPGGQATD